MKRMFVIGVVVLLLLSGTGYGIYRWAVDTASEKIDEIDIDDRVDRLPRDIEIDLDDLPRGQ